MPPSQHGVQQASFDAATPSSLEPESEKEESVSARVQQQASHVSDEIKLLPKTLRLVGAAGLLRSGSEIFESVDEETIAKYDRLIADCEALRNGPLDERLDWSYSLFLERQARIAFYVGDYVRAESALRKYLALCETHQQNPRWGPQSDWVNRTKMRLAQLHLAMGDHAEAERRLLEVEKGYRKALSSKWYPWPHAFVLNWFGVYGPTNVKIGLSECLMRLCDVYLATGDAARATQVAYELYEMHRSDIALVGADWVGHALARAYVLAGHDQAAAELFEDFDDVRGSIAAGDLIAWERAEASFLYATADYERAERRLRDLDDDTRTAYCESAESSSVRTTLARVLFAQGNTEAAEPLFRQSLEAAEKRLELNAAIQSERQQLMMTRSTRNEVNAYVSFAVKSKTNAHRAYQGVLAAKGAVFSRQRAMRAVAADPALKPAFENLQDVTRRLANLALSKGPTSEYTEKEIVKLTAQKEQLEAQLSDQSAKFREDIQSITVEAVRNALPSGAVLIDFFEYDQHIFPHERVGNADSERRLAAFVVSKNRPLELVSLPGANSLGQVIDDWRACFGGTGESLPAGQYLRAQDWEPIEARLGRASLVLVCLDGALGKLPLGALPGKEPGRFLMEEHRITLVPAARELPRLMRRESSKQVDRNILVLGGVDYDNMGVPSGHSVMQLASHTRSRRAPRDEGASYTLLPGTESELNTIARVYEAMGFERERITILQGTAGTEARIRHEAPRHYDLHLATHGFFAPPDVRSALNTNAIDTSVLGSGTATEQQLSGYHPGLLSGIALSGANRPNPNGDDGILTAEEVSTLDLSGVRLCVLSACETGLGKVAGGEGLLGLQRAFQIAGVKATITSLWKVDDKATQTLMSLFYENLWKKQMSKLEALRQAQLTMLHHYDPLSGQVRSRGITSIDDDASDRSDGRCPPRYWAAFVLSGDWR